jgi:outer membrane protein
MKTTRIILLLSTLLLLCVSSVRADFVGFKIGASYWAPELTGSFIGDGAFDTTINLVDDLALEDPTPTNLVLTLEHPIPLLPNIRFQSIELDSTGSNAISPLDPLIFNSVSYSGTVTSTFDLSHNDIVLYYEILDNWINLDIGLDIKIFDGEVKLDDGGLTFPVPIDETIPLLYLSARFDLPFSGFYIGADIAGASTGDNSLEDTSIMLGYEADSGLGFEGGIKKFSLEINDVTDVNADLEYDGIYLNGYYHF